MIAGLIVAAGKTPSGSQLEPLKKIGELPAVQRVVMVLQRAGIERVAVVCADEKAEKLTAHMNVVYLPGQEAADTLTGVKIGLLYLLGKCSAAVIAHVDAPLFSVQTVRALMAAAGEGEVCQPCHGGKIGQPVLLRAERFESVLTWFGESGLAGAIAAARLRRHVVSVEDEGVLINIHDAQGRELPLDGYGLSKQHPDIRIRICREKPFYGPGAHQLLQLTREEGSLREACRHMGLSYSKGRAIISLMEGQLGYPVIKSRKGGRTGGNSVVTPEGEALLRSYTAFLEEAKYGINKLFAKYFGP